MRRALPLLLLLATLSGTGLFEVLGLDAGACEDETAECTDCDAGCAACLCCPRLVEVSAAPAWTVAVRPPERISVAVATPPDADVQRDIFQPPRA